MPRLTVLVAVLMILSVGTLVAGGAAEDAAPRDSSPTAEDQGEVTEAPAAEPADAAGDPVEETGPDPLVMDTEIEAILAAMGMVSYSRKIPSQDFLLTDLEGNQRTLGELRGKIVFLNFWATWCPPCRDEMPAMQMLYDELDRADFEILAVNVLESRELAAGFVEEQGFTYPVVLDLEGRVLLQYGVRAFPTTYILDREGFVLGIRPGYHDWASDSVIQAFRDIIAVE